MTDLVDVRRGLYRDSVSLMQVSRSLQQVPGVSAALVAMATELNLDMLATMGFPVPEGAGPNDLIVAVRADDDAQAAALAALDAALARPAPGTGSPGPSGPSGPSTEAPARTLGAAAGRSGANIALISVPGRYAFLEATDALEAGLSVLVFSDGVPVAQEIRLKDAATARDLLVMGPDCGTAIIAGVGLGFANVVRPGPVGIVAASGTGAQQLCCLLDAAGVGVSHVLGVGGGDLSAEVAGRSTLRALAALDADPATEVVLLVSKPPAPEVAERIRAAVAGMATPVVLGLLGRGQPDLSAVAVEVLRSVGTLPAGGPEWPEWPAPVAQQPRSGALRGLFCGGTLCDEAMIVASARLGRIWSNIPLEPGWALPRDLRAPGHLMIDFGDDRLTAGRPHPMIDPSLRTERLMAEAEDPETAVLLLDVVLGHGAHPDPAGELAPATRAARTTAGTAGRDLAVVVSLIGSDGDPQGRDGQAMALRDAGAHVFTSNADAGRHATALVSGDQP